MYKRQTRDSGDEDLWEETTADWTGDELYDELEQAGSDEVASHAPTRVTAVTVGDHVEEWGADTPIRWSHQVRVTFKGEDGKSRDNAYEVQAQRGEDGWILNSVSFMGITAESESGGEDEAPSDDSTAEEDEEDTTEGG